MQTKKYTPKNTQIQSHKNTHTNLLRTKRQNRQYANVLPVQGQSINLFRRPGISIFGLIGFYFALCFGVYSILFNSIADLSGGGGVN